MLHQNYSNNIITSYYDIYDGHIVKFIEKENVI